MSNMSGFGLKMQLIKKLEVNEVIASKEEVKFLIKSLYEMSEIRNYFAHTVISRSKVIDGKHVHLKTRRTDDYEKTLTELTKPFHESSETVIKMLSRLCDYYNGESLVRLKERVSAELDSHEPCF